MYHRYGPSPKPCPMRQGKPTAGEMGRPPQKSATMGQNRNPSRTIKTECKETPKDPKKKALSAEGILNLLPPALYHRDTKKILGFFTAEDLLLLALMFLLLEGDSDKDGMVVYLLLYLLISDYLDLPF